MVKDKLVPKLRFVNENEWGEFTLGAIGKTYSGLSGLSKDNFNGGNSKYITYKSIFDNNILKKNLTESVDLNNKSQNKVKKGDLFFTGSSETPEEVGMVSVLNFDIDDCYLNSFCFGYRLNDFKKISPTFLAYYLRSPIMRNKIQILAQGSTRFNLSKKETLKLRIKIPKMEEQLKISNFFMNIDKKIELLKTKHNYYEDFKKYLMQQIFAQKLRFNFTDEWKKYLLGDISLIGKGFTPSTNNPSFWDGDLKWLSIADMNQGKYINQTTKKITYDGSKNKEPVKKGTLLMSFKLSIGKLGILTEDMYTNEAICNFKWKNKDVLTEYMYYYLSSINVLKYGSQAAKGITLNNETLSTIPVLLPSLEEQKKIINILSDVDMKINMLENSINDTSKFKKGLLQQMFI